MNPCKVTIMNRKNAEAYLSQVNDELTAMVSIYGTDEEAISDGVFGNIVVEILRVCFDDVDCDEGSENGRRCISHRQGLEIAQFVKRVKDKVTRMIVHCGAGMSRSAGCAAAIMYYFYCSDEDIFSNALYKPNMKVYRTVLNALNDYYTDK